MNYLRWLEEDLDVRQERARIVNMVQTAERNLNAALEAAHRAGLQISVEVDEVQEMGELFDMPILHVGLFAPLK